MPMATEVTKAVPASINEFHPEKRGPTTEETLNESDVATLVISGRLHLARGGKAKGAKRANRRRADRFTTSRFHQIGFVRP